MFTTVRTIDDQLLQGYCMDPHSLTLSALAANIFEVLKINRCSSLDFFFFYVHVAEGLPIYH